MTAIPDRISPAADLSDRTRSLESVSDPVCGATVDPASARARYDFSGRTYYFCSTICQTRFGAAPMQYLSTAPPRPIKQIVPPRKRAEDPVPPPRIKYRDMMQPLAVELDPCCGLAPDPAGGKGLPGEKGASTYICHPVPGSKKEIEAGSTAPVGGI